jgi:hypothetical protein
MPDDTPIFDALVERFYGPEAVSCVHGLSLSLCDGPMHYPPDNPYDDFPF